MKNIFAIVLLGFLFMTCQKEVTIDIPLPKDQPLFIEGMLFPNQQSKIYISQSSPFFGTNVTPQEIFVRGATVTISDGTIVDNLTPDSTFNSFRCRWEPYYAGSILPEFGKTYTLDINYDGKTYTASTTIDQQKVNIETIEYTPEFFDVYGGHDGVIINVKDPVGIGQNYRFQMDRMITNAILHAHALDGFINDCTQPDELFFVKDIGRVIFSDEKVDGKMIEMYIEVSYEYLEGDEATVYIQSLDNKSAEFYKNLDEQLVAINNPFVEPIFIETQIEGAIGVFGSGVMSDPILFVYPQDNP